MKPVVRYGDVYRLSDRSYKRMLKAFAEGKESPSWEELRGKLLGRISMNVTDGVDTEEAKMLLASMR